MRAFWLLVTGRGLWIGFAKGRAHLLDGQVRASHTITDGLGTGRISDFLFDSD